MIMKDLFHDVLDDADEAVENGYWIEISIVNHGKVILEYGTIHTNGMHEQAIATISYELVANGNIVTNKMVHS